MSWIITVDDSKLQDELKRLADGPSLADGLRFDSILQAVYAQTQLIVHVITHSLKSSGRVNSTNRNNKLDGEVRYGGPSPGSVYDPVKYAEYEQGKGGTHDFMEPAAHYDGEFVEVVLAYMRGDT